MKFLLFIKRTSLFLFLTVLCSITKDLTFINCFWTLQLSSTSSSFVASSILHFIFASGKDNGNINVISFVMSSENLPYILNLPFFPHSLSLSNEVISNVGGESFLLSSS